MIGKIIVITPDNYDEFLANGRVVNCNCGQIQCVCEEARKHKEGCRFLKVLTCPIPIECEHGCDVCPECDACTCGGE